MDTDTRRPGGRRRGRTHLLGRIAGSVTTIAVAVLPGLAAGTEAPSPLGLQPRVVNGTATTDYPAVGMLLLFEDSTAANLYGACSGTLIGCRTFLTAAHCVCPDMATDAAECERRGLTDPATLRVFLQHGGMVHVDRVAISPDYSFAVRGDVALVTLSEPITGVAPLALNTTRRPDLGTTGMLVGFGTTAAGRGSTDDSGIKREGKITIGQCPADLPSGTHLCWPFDGSGANSCEGDSGGPWFVDFGTGQTVAAVTSGGYSFDCQPPDTGFASDVFVNRTWLAEAAGTDLGTDSCDLPAAGTSLTTTTSGAGQLSVGQPEARLAFDVPSGTPLLRVALNAQFGSAMGFFGGGTNDVDLYVRAGSEPTTDTFDCADTNPTPLGFCEIAAPRPGPWHVLVRLQSGAGAYQLTATTFGAASTQACTGDCAGDGSVTVNEVLDGARIVLGESDLATCPSFDANGDGVVTIAELMAAVGFALNGCPGH